MRSPASVAKLFAIALAVCCFVGTGLNVAWAVEGQRSDLVNRQVLRVCADPANMPFSNQKGEGFENKIAEVIADELQVPVEYTWFPQATGFVRNTLLAKRCDVIIGTGQGNELVLNTNHFYRSAYSLVYKPGIGLDGVESLFDPRLKGKRIGVVIGTPSATLVAKAGLMEKARPYRLMVDRRFDDPAKEMVDAIRSGEIDAAVMWGPIAGYYATHGGEKLNVVPLIKDAKETRTEFRITMGVRQGDDIWKRQLNEVILKRQADIDTILLEFGVPLIDEDEQLIAKPRG